jgi:predicted nucleotidyltransferase
VLPDGLATKIDTEESELDVLVELVRGTTLFTLAGAKDEAQQLIGVSAMEN